MDVRPAQPEDLEAVVALWEHTGLTRPWNDPHEDFHRARECEQSELLVGVQDGRVCGSAVLGDDGHRGWIYLVAIDPSRDAVSQISAALDGMCFRATEELKQ